MQFNKICKAFFAKFFLNYACAISCSVTSAFGKRHACLCFQFCHNAKKFGAGQYRSGCYGNIRFCFGHLHNFNSRIFFVNALRYIIMHGKTVYKGITTAWAFAYYPRKCCRVPAA